MPFVSKAQQRYMFWKHPQIARRWAHKTKSIKALPERKRKKKRKKRNLAKEWSERKK